MADTLTLQFEVDGSTFTEQVDLDAELTPDEFEALCLLAGDSSFDVTDGAEVTLTDEGVAAFVFILLKRNRPEFGPEELVAVRNLIRDLDGSSILIGAG